MHMRSALAWKNDGFGVLHHELEDISVGVGLCQAGGSGKKEEFRYSERSCILT